HVAVELRLLGLLREDLRVVERDVARQPDRVRRDVDEPLGVGQPETHGVAQLVLAHAAGRVERQDHLLARLRGEAQHRVGLLRVVDHLGALRLRGKVALQIEREPGSARHVERLERQLLLAAQVEAAAAQDERERDREDAPHHTTTFTRRPGTTTTLRTGCPFAWRATASCASAIFSSSSRPADLGARRWPRSLPFTCRTSSISSCSSAFASGCGQGARSTSSPRANSRHSVWQMCGAIGDRTRSSMESPSLYTAWRERASPSALPGAASSSAFRILMQVEATVLNWLRSMSQVAWLSCRCTWRRTSVNAGESVAEPASGTSATRPCNSSEKR